MEYASIDEARRLNGLRLVLGRGSPNPWCQAAIAVFNLKGIAFTPVAQEPGLDAGALEEWTGQTSAPAAMLNDERPRTRWNQIVLLAEQLRPSPPLIPKDQALRAEMFGVLHEICDEDGFGWNHRLVIFPNMEEQIARDERAGNSTAAGWSAEGMRRRRFKYGSSHTVQHCAAREAVVVQDIGRRLRQGKNAGSRYLIGADLTAADIYWAAFTVLLRPLDPDRCSFGPQYDIVFNSAPRDIVDAIDDVVWEHREYIISRYFRLPLQA